VIHFSVLFAVVWHWRNFRYFLDPNKPLLPKIEIVSVALIIALLRYKFRNRKNRIKDTPKKATEGKPTIGIKVCPYCGAKYTSDKAECAIDQSRLVPK
jgi:hypothetical protein